MSAAVAFADAHLDLLLALAILGLLALLVTIAGRVRSVGREHDAAAEMYHNAAPDYLPEDVDDNGRTEWQSAHDFATGHTGEHPTIRREEP